MKKMTFLLMICLFPVAFANAQSTGPATLNASGGTTSIAGNDFEWSIGEMTMVSTFSSSSITVTQGVLQPAAVSDGVKNVNSLEKSLHVFPNPASTYVELQYSSSSGGRLSYKLTDMLGRVARTGTAKVAGGTLELQVEVTELAAATYLLEVTVENENGAVEATSYKIDKIK